MERGINQMSHFEIIDKGRICQSQSTIKVLVIMKTRAKYQEKY